MLVLGPKIYGMKLQINLKTWGDMVNPSLGALIKYLQTENVIVNNIYYIRKVQL